MSQDTYRELYPTPGQLAPSQAFQDSLGPKKSVLTLLSPSPTQTSHATTSRQSASTPMTSRPWTLPLSSPITTTSQPNSHKRSPPSLQDSFNSLPPPSLPPCSSVFQYQKAIKKNRKKNGGKIALFFCFLFYFYFFLFATPDSAPSSSGLCTFQFFFPFYFYFIFFNFWGISGFFF